MYILLTTAQSLVLLPHYFDWGCCTATVLSGLTRPVNWTIRGARAQW